MEEPPNKPKVDLKDIPFSSLYEEINRRLAEFESASQRWQLALQEMKEQVHQHQHQLEEAEKKPAPEKDS